MLSGGLELSRKFDKLIHCDVADNAYHNETSLSSTSDQSAYTQMNSPTLEDESSNISPTLRSNKSRLTNELGISDSATYNTDTLLNGSKAQYPLPELAARFDESPWVWGNVDTSPLKLSDMQQPTSTPESIRRQRSFYPQRHGCLNSPAEKKGCGIALEFYEETSEKEPIKDTSREAHVGSFEKYLAFPQSRNDLDLNVALEIRNQTEKSSYSLPTKSSNPMVRGNRNVDENQGIVSEEAGDVSSSNVSALLDCSEKLLNEDDASFSLTYTHTERMSTESLNSSAMDILNSASTNRSGAASWRRRSYGETSYKHRSPCKTLLLKSKREMFDRHPESATLVDVEPSSALQPICKNHRETTDTVRELRYSDDSRDSADRIDSSCHDQSSSKQRAQSHENRERSSGRSRSSNSGSQKHRRSRTNISPVVATQIDAVRGGTPFNRNDYEDTSKSSIKVDVSRGNLSCSIEKGDTMDSATLSALGATSSRLSSEVARWRRLCQESIIRAQQLKLKSRLLERATDEESLRNTPPISFSSEPTSIVRPMGSVAPSHTSCWSNPPNTGLNTSCDADTETSRSLDVTKSDLCITKENPAIGHITSQGGEPPTSTFLTPAGSRTASSWSSSVSSSEYRCLMNNVYYSGNIPCSVSDMSRSCTAKPLSTVQHPTPSPYFSSYNQETPKPTLTYTRRSLMIPRPKLDPAKGIHMTIRNPPTPSYNSSESCISCFDSASVEKTSSTSNQPSSSGYPVTSSEVNSLLSCPTLSTDSTSASIGNIIVTQDSTPYSIFDSATPFESASCSLQPSSVPSNTVSLSGFSINFPSVVLPGTGGTRDSFFSSTTGMGTLHSTGTDLSSFSKGIYLEDNKVTPIFNGQKQYGRCCFFQGPTPLTAHQRKGVYDPTECLAPDSCMNEVGTLQPSRDQLEVRRTAASTMATIQEQEDEEASFVTPYPIKDGNGTTLKRKDTHVAELQALPETLNSSSCGNVKLTSGKLHSGRVAKRLFKVRTQRRLSSTTIKLIRRKTMGVYLLGQLKKRLSPAHTRKHTQQKSREKESSCNLGRGRTKRKFSKGCKNVNTLLFKEHHKPTEHDPNVATGSRKSTLALNGNMLTVETGSGIAGNIDLSSLWLQVNRKLNEYGVCKNGIPVLERDVGRVYTDLLTKTLPSVTSHAAQRPASLHGDPLEDRARLKALSDPSFFKDNVASVAAVKKFSRFKCRRDTRKKIPDLQPEAHGRDAIAVLLANVDVVQVLKLWNETLDELQKYHRYCAELCHFENLHTRIFQKNDSLHKENVELKEKVEALERLLQQTDNSESAHWQSEVDRYHLEVQNERLLKLLKEERQKLKVVALQKRQSDVAFNHVKDKTRKLLEKEDRIRSKAKATLEKVTRSRSGSIPLTKQLPYTVFPQDTQTLNIHRRALLSGTKASFRKGSGNRFNASLGPKAVPHDDSRTLHPGTHFSRLKKDMCANEGLLELIWYYEDQLEILEEQKKEMSKQLAHLKKPIHRQSRLSALNTSPPLRNDGQYTESPIEDSPGESKEKGKPPMSTLTETMATTATSNVDSAVHEKPRQITAQKEENISAEQSNNSTRPHGDLGNQHDVASRWVVTELHDQIKKLLEEKIKNEIQYEAQIRDLKLALDNGTTSGPRDIALCEEHTITPTERDCAILTQNKPCLPSTRDMIARDKKLFHSGLKERLSGLRQTGNLVSIVDKVCRSLQIDDPQRLPSVVLQLSAAVKEAVRQQDFVKNIAGILGSSFLFSEKKYEEMEHVLIKWRRVLSTSDQLVHMKQLLVEFLECLTTDEALCPQTLFSGLQACTTQSSVDVCRIDEEEISNVLRCMIDAVKQARTVKENNVDPQQEEGMHHQHETAVDPQSDNDVTSQHENNPAFPPRGCSVTTLASAVDYFMNLFKVPSLDLCQAAMDRLHLKVREHIRFYRGTLTVLNLEPTSPPAQILQTIMELKNRAVLSKSELNQEVYQTLFNGDTVALPTRELKDLFKVFRALQIRLNLPDPPPSALGDMFIFAGDETVTQRLGVPKPRGLSRSRCSDADRDELGGGLLSCSSSTSSLLSSSSQHMEQQTQWKHWAKMCFFTVDLMARIVERFHYTAMQNQDKHHKIPLA